MRKLTIGLGISAVILIGFIISVPSLANVYFILNPTVPPPTIMVVRTPYPTLFPAGSEIIWETPKVKVNDLNPPTSRMVVVVPTPRSIVTPRPNREVLIPAEFTPKPTTPPLSQEEKLFVDSIRALQYELLQVPDSMEIGRAIWRLNQNDELEIEIDVASESAMGDVTINNMVFSRDDIGNRIDRYGVHYVYMTDQRFRFYNAAGEWSGGEILRLVDVAVNTE